MMLMNQDEAVVGLFAPEALLPQQMDCNTGRSRAELSGVHRLMLAVLEDAVSVYAKTLCGRVVSPRDARDVHKWFRSRDRASLFAFERICDLLALDAEYVRKGLRRMEARPHEVATRLALRHLGRPPRPAAGRSHRRGADSPSARRRVRTGTYAAAPRYAAAGR